ncbi:MAG: FkbM family methyltransferase [Geminicoccaceae bacterium]
MSDDAVRRRLRDLDAQLADTLRLQGIDAVIDVGANRGQYARRLRSAGWRGPILSIEPIPELHAELRALAAGDATWEITPPMAIGDSDGKVVLELSAESDMSSTLEQSTLLREISPSSAVTHRIEVTQHRLDSPELLAARPWRRIFVKADVQGAEPAVLAGLEGVWPRVRGLQLELALLPLYRGERPWLETVAALAVRDFAPHLMIPGYYARKLGRQVQLDIVFYRD